MKRAILTRKRPAPLAAQAERGVPRVGCAGAVKAWRAGFAGCGGAGREVRGGGLESGFGGPGG
ncbi:hypothetical protein LEN_2136 [Lysobacter enzymogenes]|uniref:Uncharacterized protein n=1 Tax=Lysobacter enzymogenes TaxID=69 RepID=A0AAU9ALZ8_LYSEN|nr:hypothetical protein LEN_2136 [Lysobacter enzymogenes]